MILRACLVFCMLAGIFSCRPGKKAGGDILEEKRMMQVLGDVAKAEEYANLRSGKDSTLVYKDELMLQYKRVFAKNNITRQQFFKSMKYYLSNPYLAKDMFDSLQAQMRRTAFDRMPVPPQKITQ